jgi:DNA-binding winged helix-turn-helix (wHTH) protein
MLLERPGELVTREEIREKLWPGDTFIDFEKSINTSIKRLREALGYDAAAPRFIETLPRHGYRFIAPVDGHARDDTPTVAPVPSPAIPVAAMSPSPGEKAVRDRRYSRRWKVLVPAALILVVATIGGTLYFRSRQTAPPP